MVRMTSRRFKWLRMLLLCLLKMEPISEKVNTWVMISFIKRLGRPKPIKKLKWPTNPRETKRTACFQASDLMLALRMVETLTCLRIWMTIFRWLIKTLLKLILMLMMSLLPLTLEGGIKMRIHKSLKKLEVKKSRIKEEQSSRLTWTG